MRSCHRFFLLLQEIERFICEALATRFNARTPCLYMLNIQVSDQKVDPCFHF